MNFLGLSPPCVVNIKFQNEESLRYVDLKKDSGRVRLPLFYGADPVVGQVKLVMNPGKKIEHAGIKIELVGQIEMFYDRGNHYEFLNAARELAPAGELSADATFDFEFRDVEKKEESYNGINVRLRYFLRFTILVKKSLRNVLQEQDLWVQNFSTEPEVNTSIKMEVGIEDCLHIEFEYNHSKYHLKDVIIGKIYFLLVRIKIKHMEIALIRRESTGTGPNLYNQNDTLTKFEVMDGAPVRGESIPVRLFLGGFDLTPTYRNIHNKFSLKYYLNLVLLDEDDRRYFKQQEVTLWRKRLGVGLDKPIGGSSGQSRLNTPDDAIQQQQQYESSHEEESKEEPAEEQPTEPTEIE